jgi:pyruvate dehydrogenase E1 component alpha subunit
MAPEDLLLPYAREQGAQLLRGVTLTELFLYWGGDERGSDFQGPREDFPISVPVGTHAPHAAGVALAFTLRKEPRVAVFVSGDGSTSKGDFYEALNVAGVWRLPVVFVVTNNQWAISAPRSAQTAAATLAQKAIAAGRRRRRPRRTDPPVDSRTRRRTRSADHRRPESARSLRAPSWHRVRRRAESR